MKRAAVILGVGKTGNLPALQAAVSSAKAMANWVVSQGFMAPKVLTDETQSVSIRSVKDAIKAFVDLGTVEQLVVYFSGHGVNIRYGEYWLLSGAPDDPQEAVNVEGSVVLARRSGIGHVVFVSDACRTAADGIQAQSVTGSEIFPNVPGGGQEKPVDLFFATTLGAPALEVRTPAESFARYKALYTDALVDCLSGRVAECRESVREQNVEFDLVRPWPLRSYLEIEVPRRLTNAAVTVSAFQVPDARITSPPLSWLSRFPKSASRGGSIPLRTEEIVEVPPTSSAPSAIRQLFPVANAEEKSGPPLPEQRLLDQEATQRSEPFGRTHFESRCGFKIRGGNFVNAYESRRQLILDGPDSVRVDTERPISVLLQFDTGSGVILPAIPEFIAGLTLRNGELVDVVYEPSDTSWRWQEYVPRAQVLRSLRGRVAAASHFGVFRLEGDDALRVARQMQLSKSFDPTMALYAAYAYDNLQEAKRLREMQEYLAGDLELRFFDIALLIGTLDGENPAALNNVYPQVPMLAQGWALLEAHKVTVPERLRELPKTVSSSLWTVFTPVGVELLRAALQAGEIH